jgi:antitoxin (DNA-binding transcriptional repressor) of toxin-antitoxin stability system
MNVTLQQAEQTLKELIARSAHERVVITENDQPLAEIVPLASAKPAPRFGSCQGMLQLISDDEDHLDDFADYMP